MAREKIFPDFDFSIDQISNQYEVRIETTVRIFEINSQKWYKTKIIQKTILESNYSQKGTLIAIKDTFSRFIQDCYFAMTIGRADLSIVDVFSNPVFEEDDSQISEKDRIIQFTKKRLGL